MPVLRDIAHGFASKFLPLYPFGAVFVVTDRCNARCRMCDIWKYRRNELDWKIFRDYLRSPVMTGIVNAAFTGGEPTLRNDLDLFFGELLDRCPRLESVNISTNALLPDRLVEILERFAAIRRGRNREVNILVQMSLDGPGEIHDRIRGVPGAYGKVMESLMRVRRLTEPGIDQYFLCVLQPDNIDHLDRIESMFADLNRPVTYNVLCDASYVISDRSSCLHLTPDQKNRISAFFMRQLSRPDLDFRHRYHYREIVQWTSLPYRPRPCGLITQHIIVGSDGRLLPCLNSGEIVYPDIRIPDELNRFWRSAERRRINRRILKELCPGCRAGCGPNIFDASLALLRDSFHRRISIHPNSKSHP